MTGWQRLPLRRLGDIVGGGTPSPDETNWNGDVPFVTPPDLRDVVGRAIARTGRTLTRAGASRGSAIVPAGSVILSIRAPIGYVATAVGPVAFNQGCRALIPFDGVHAQFLSYALIAAGSELQALGRGTTFLEVSASQMAAFEIDVPSYLQQRDIADYLDRETAQIDALIAKQEQLIAALRERRVAVITKAVTMGTRVAEMQNSGADWFSLRPVHWKTARLKWSVRSAQTGTWGSDPLNDGSDVVCIRVADFDRPHLAVGAAGTRRSISASERATRLLTDGDLLLEKSGGTGLNPVGFVAYFSDIGEPAVSSNFITRLRTVGHSRYWLYAHAASYATRLTARSVNQTTGIQNLDQSSYFNELFPFPPENEQNEIAAHLDRQTAKIDALIAKAERFIELSKERRAALITAAVTGQLDIPA